MTLVEKLLNELSRYNQMLVNVCNLDQMLEILDVRNAILSEVLKKKIDSPADSLSKKIALTIAETEEINLKIVDQLLKEKESLVSQYQEIMNTRSKLSKYKTKIIDL